MLDPLPSARRLRNSITESPQLQALMLATRCQGSEESPRKPETERTNNSDKPLTNASGESFVIVPPPPSQPLMLPLDKIKSLKPQDVLQSARGMFSFINRSDPMESFNLKAQMKEFRQIEIKKREGQRRTLKAQAKILAKIILDNSSLFIGTYSTYISCFSELVKRSCEQFSETQDVSPEISILLSQVDEKGVFSALLPITRLMRYYVLVLQLS
jgi:hypothetical protein